MNRLSSWPAVAVAAAIGTLASLRPARACDPVGLTPHTVTPALQASDQTPPTLPALPSAIVYRPGEAGCGGSCGWRIEIAALATDDMTSSSQIGYRITPARTLPAGFTVPDFAVDPVGDHVVLYGDFGDDPFGFTLRVVAIDLAGNESPPQNVEVGGGPGHACALAQPQASHTVPIVAVAVLLLAARRARGHRNHAGERQSRSAARLPDWRP
jgi:hypothetical protein